MIDPYESHPVDLAPALVPARLLALLDQAAPLTVIRGPRGFGKSALARAFAESLDPTRIAAVRVLASAGSDAGQLWRSVTARAIATGVVHPVEAPVPAESVVDFLRDQLNRAHRHFVLILERVDLIDDVDVEQQVMDLVDSCPRVNVVVTVSGRSMFRDSILIDHSIVRIGSETLLHTVEDLRELSDGTGARLNPDELEAVHRYTGGLPTLTPVVLDFATSLPRLPRRRRILEQGIGEAIAAHVNSVVLGTPEASEHHDFLVAVSTAHTFTNEVAEFLYGGDVSRDLLEALESRGLVDYRESTETWSLPPAVRRVLLDRQQDAGLNRQSRLAMLALRHIDRRDYGTALRYAIEAGQWALVATLAEDHLADLVGPHLTLLAAALRELPAPLVETRPLLGVARSVLTHLDGTPVTEVRSESATSASADASEIVLTTHRSILTRLAGDYTSAAALTDRLRSSARSLTTSRPDELAEFLPFLRMQWGLTYQLTGRFTESNAELRMAHRLGTAREQDYIARNAAANSALNWAMAGDTNRADEWLALAHATTASDDWTDALVGIGVFLAQALTALDRIDTNGAGVALDHLGNLPPVVELWPFIAYTRCRYEILSGRPHLSSAVLAEYGTDRRSRGTFVDSLLDAARIETHLALGNGRRARALGDTVSYEYPWEAVAAARAHLLTGNYTTVASICSRYDWYGGPYIRFHLDALVIEAAAQQALGNSDDAAATWRRACAIAERTGIRSSFTGIPREVAIAIDTAAGVPTSEVSAVLAETTAQPYPSALRFSDLTDRERSVLEGLVQGLTAGEIADALVLSVSTVKSHRQTLYKKLDVHTRNEAVAVAGELGILVTEGICGVTPPTDR